VATSVIHIREAQVWTACSEISDFKRWDRGTIVLVLLWHNGIKITQNNPGSSWSLGLKVVPKRSASNNSIQTINKSSSKSVVSRQAMNINMDSLGRGINHVNMNNTRIPQHNYSGRTNSFHIWDKIPALQLKLMPELKLGETNLVSKRPHTSKLCFYMRRTSSCCFRGLLSPLTFQLNMSIT